MGTDVRKLAYDGYPASNIFGCDLRVEYIELGYKLYTDEDTTPIRFFASDMFSIPVDFSPSSTDVGPETKITDLSQLRGKVTHLYAGALFHLFDDPTQYAIALRLAALLTRERGTIVFGRHQGLEHEGMIDDHLGRCVHFLSLGACVDHTPRIAIELVMGTPLPHGSRCGSKCSPK